MARKLYSFEAGNKIAAFNLDNLRIANNPHALSSIHMFGTNVVFGVGVLYGSILPVEPNPRGGLTSSWKISNECTLQEYGRE